METWKLEVIRGRSGYCKENFFFFRKKESVQLITNFEVPGLLPFSLMPLEPESPHISISSIQSITDRGSWTAEGIRKYIEGIASEEATISAFLSIAIGF